MNLKIASAVLAAIVMTGCSGGRDTTHGTSLGPCDSSCDIRKEMDNRVYFNFDQYRLDEKSAACAANQAAWLRSNPGVDVVIEGHASEEGTREYNLVLGEKRALAVRAALAANGVDLQRMRVVSYGKDKPPVDALTPEARRVAVTKIK